MSTSVEDRANPITPETAEAEPTPTGDRAELVRQIRAARAPALANGRRPPGSRALASALKVPRHRVREVLESGEADPIHPPEPPARPPGEPGAPGRDQAGEAGDHTSPEPAPTAPAPADTGPDLEPAPSPAPTPAEPPAARTSARANHTQLPGRWPLALIGLAAAVAIWGGWVDLGHLTGFGLIHPLPGLPGWAGDLQINTAIVLPIGIEAYGLYAIRVWLSSAALSARTRDFARFSAWASLGVGAGAQIASHLLRAADITAAPWWLTTLVACVPVAVLGLGTALTVLIRRDTHPGDHAGEGGR